MKVVIFVVALAFLISPVTLEAQDNAKPTGILRRIYHAGEIVKYRMKGNNQGWQYEVDATGAVRQDATGVWYEEFTWSNLRSTPQMTLPASAAEFRQRLSLDTGFTLSVPDLRKISIDFNRIPSSVYANSESPQVVRRRSA